MIKFECDKGDVRISVEGDVPELTSDILSMIHIIHAKICNNSIIEGLIFEDVIRNGLDIAFKPFSGDADVINNITDISEVVEADEK